MNTRNKHRIIIVFAIFLTLSGITYDIHSVDVNISSVGEDYWLSQSDTTPPVVTVSVPTVVQEGDSFDIYIHATDDTGLWSYSVTSDDFLWVSWYPISGTSFSRTLNVYIGDPGTYNIYVTFTDEALNERTVTRTITILEATSTPQPSTGPSPLILLIALPALAFIVVVGVAVSRKRDEQG